MNKKRFPSAFGYFLKMPLSFLLPFQFTVFCRRNPVQTPGALRITKCYHYQTLETSKALTLKTERQIPCFLSERIMFKNNNHKLFWALCFWEGLYNMCDYICQGVWYMCVSLVCLLYSVVMWYNRVCYVLHMCNNEKFVCVCVCHVFMYVFDMFGCMCMYPCMVVVCNLHYARYVYMYICMCACVCVCHHVIYMWHYLYVYVLCKCVHVS